MNRRGKTWAVSCAAAFSLILMLTPPGQADDSPISISPEAIGGQPKVKVNHLSGGDQWQLAWRRDDAERSLNLVFTRAKGNNKPRLAVARDIHDKVFEEGLTEDKDSADVRVEDSGKSEVWGGKAQWVLGSELAERAPTFAATAEDMANGGATPGKAPRGPERRFCVSFVWSDGAKQVAGGAYCVVLPPEQHAVGEAMLQALDLRID